MAYKAPIWEDGKSPAISAENLNNLSQAAEGAQVLYGNSAPTSSTKGAVGQFYLVVVADSDGNYPLYQCVAIANGSYTWRDTRRIPDSITSMLGIPAPGTINRALNVLANVGNLHVWQRVQTYSEPVPEVPAGYTLGEVEENVAVTGISSSQVGLYVGDSISVDSDGNVTINNEQYHFNDPSGAINGWYGSSYSTLLAGKFCRVENSTRYTTLVSGVFYVPVGTTLVNPNNNTLTIPSLQCVTGYPYTPAIPAGTTTDYLTSTDRNAYPDNVTDAQDAYYTLGDTVTGEFIISTLANPTVDYKYHVSSSVVVSEDGTVHLSGDYITVNFSHGHAPTKSDFAGKFVQYYGRSSSGETDSPPDTNPPFNSTPSQIVYVPNDVNIIITTPSYIDRYQPVTGHAAIPANTTITYLGQLGGGARIEVGSYVGTGTYGSSNKCSISFNSVPKMVFLGPSSNYGGVVKILWPGATKAGSYYNSSSLLTLTWSDDNKTVSWYGSDTENQCNKSGQTYRVYALI